MLIRLIVMTFLCNSLTVMAQSPAIKQNKELKEKRKIQLQRWQQQIEKDRERIRQLLGVDSLGGLSERFEQLMQEFMKDQKEGGLDRFFDQDLDSFMDKWDPYSALGEGQIHWMETPKERILILKLKTQKDSPVDIKIENGMIHVSGTMTEIHEMNGVKTQSTSSFSQSYSVPEDVDGKKAKFENKDGDILIKLPKLNPSKTKSAADDSFAPRKTGPSTKPIEKREGEPVI